MSGKAHVSSSALHDMKAGIKACATSVAMLRAKMRLHIDICMERARGIVVQLNASVDEAQARYDKCSDKYSDCIDSQRYDEESGEYHPSCSSEKNLMEKAASDLYNAKSALEQAEMRLQDMQRELDNYERPPLGGQFLMDQIVLYYTPLALKRLNMFIDKVERYEALEITGIDIGDSSSPTPVIQNPVPKAQAFGQAEKRLRDKMEQRAALFGGYCPKCKCCPCQCDNIRELLMDKSR